MEKWMRARCRGYGSSVGQCSTLNKQVPGWLHPLRLSLRYFALVRHRLSQDPGPSGVSSSRRSVCVQQAESVRIRL